MTRNANNTADGPCLIRLISYSRMAGTVYRLIRPGGMLMVVDGSGGDIFETLENMVE